MSDLYSRVAMQKKFQGKELSSVVKKGAGNLAGQRLNNLEARKVLAETLSYKSKDARDRILRKMGLDYKDRNKFEQDTFGAKKISTSELRAMEAKRLKQIKYNIAMSVKAADADYNNLIGQRVGSGGKTRRSFYTGRQKDYNHMEMSDRSVHRASALGGKDHNISNLGFRNAPKSLATNSNAYGLTGGNSAKKNSTPGIGRGGMIRPVGLNTIH